MRGYLALALELLLALRRLALVETAPVAAAVTQPHLCLVQQLQQPLLLHSARRSAVSRLALSRCQRFCTCCARLRALPPWALRR